MTKIAIFIPAYNVGLTIATVLERIPSEIKKSVGEIFIIDNNSKDNTVITALDYKEKNKLHHLKIIQNKENKGYGGSQKIAYQYAIEQGYDVVVMLHGDAQSVPEFNPELLNPILKEDADLVFGSRMQGNPLKGGMPFWRYLGNKTMTSIENFVLRTHLSEFHSGYRVYKCSALKKIPFKLCSNDYYFDSQILVQFIAAKMKITEIAIPTYYSKESKSPTVYQTIVYCERTLLTLLQYIVHKCTPLKKEMFYVK